MSEEQKVQERPVVDAEMLLAMIVESFGERIVILPTDGWTKVLKVLAEYDEKMQKKFDELGEEYTSIVDTLNDMQIPVAPIELQGKEQEESRIITPSNSKKEGNIILP